MNALYLVNSCSNDPAGADCTNWRTEFENALDERGLQEKVTGHPPLGILDKSLSLALSDLDDKRIAPEQLETYYTFYIATYHKHQAKGFVKIAAAASLTAGAIVGSPYLLEAGVACVKDYACRRELHIETIRIVEGLMESHAGIIAMEAATSKAAAKQITKWLSKDEKATQQLLIAIEKGDIPAYSIVAWEGLRQQLAIEAGIPRSLDQVWGSPIENLVQAYKMDKAIVNKAVTSDKSSGAAIIYSIAGHPFMKEIQYHPGGFTHGKGEYYKFTYKDGTVVKIIDPSTNYNPLTIAANQIYFDTKGNRLKYEGGTWKPW